VGIAPYVAQIKFHSLTNSKTKIRLYYFDNKPSLRIIGMLEEFKKSNGNFDYTTKAYPSLDSIDKNLEDTVCVIGSQVLWIIFTVCFLKKGINRKNMVFEQNYPSSYWKRMGYGFDAEERECVYCYKGRRS